MTDVVRWLDARRPPPPPSLRRAVDAAIAASRSDADHADALEVADRLAEAGLAGLEAVLAGPRTREAALPLLAVDALLTYACEAAVEEEAAGRAGALDRVLERLGPVRFAAILGRGPAR